MSSNTSKYPPQPPFTQAIELYGDRAGSKGTFKFAGFAWIQRTKIILVQGNPHNLNSAAEWRCLLRLTALAHRLKKPILLWNIPVTHIAAIQRRTSLACAHVIQKTELELLRLPHPIITVFEGPDNVHHAAPEIIWNDGCVLITAPNAQFSEQKKIKIAQHPTDIAPAILELLCQARAVPATELIKNRRESLHFLVKSELTIQ